MTYQPTHYDIWITPIFTKDGMEYKFEGLIHVNENRKLFRFIVLTLRKYFGINLYFERKETKIIIATLSSAQMKILREINEDTGDFPVKYGRSQLKFEIGTYKYDAPPCDGTRMCECNECCNDDFKKIIKKTDDDYYTFIYCTMHDDGCIIKGNHPYVPEGYSMQHSEECKSCDWVNMGIIDANFDVVENVRVNYDRYDGGFMFIGYRDTLTDENGNRMLQNDLLNKWIEEFIKN